MIYYLMPLYLKLAFENIGYKKGYCPITEKVIEGALPIPMYSQLKQKNQ